MPDKTFSLLCRVIRCCDFATALGLLALLVEISACPRDNQRLKSAAFSVQEMLWPTV